MKRFYVLLSVVLSIGFICSCDNNILSDEPEPPLAVNYQKLNLYVGDTITIKTNKKLSEVNISSLDNYYASVDKTGLVTANKVGKTTIQVSSIKNREYVTIPVEVKSTYSLFPDLEQYLGKDISSLLGVFGEHDRATYIEEYYAYAYIDRGKYTIDFAFLTEYRSGENIIVGIFVYVPVTYLKQIGTHMIDRYYCYEVLNDEFYFTNHDNNVDIKMSVNYDYVMITYV